MVPTGWLLKVDEWKTFHPTGVYFHRVNSCFLHKVSVYQKCSLHHFSVLPKSGHTSISHFPVRKFYV